MKDFFMRLTSRKFLLTVAAACILAANNQWAEFVVLVSGYMGIEGLGDAADRVAAQKTKQVELTNATELKKAQASEMDFSGGASDVDTSMIIAGDAPL